MLNQMQILSIFQSAQSMQMRGDDTDTLSAQIGRFHLECYIKL